LLGVFAKVVLGQTVKSRMQRRLDRQEAEELHVACLADTLETAWDLDAPLCLFLQGGESPEAVNDLGARLGKLGFPWERWQRLPTRPQVGEDLGERLENAVSSMVGPEKLRPCLIVGSDHPSLPASALRDGLDRLDEMTARLRASSTLARTADAQASPELLLGPTEDGGYWSIGCVRPIPGLLRGVNWSAASTLEETRERAQRRGLRVELLQPWTDLDVPEDLPGLVRQIATHRARGDARTARHTERLLRRLDLLHP